jgi:predicted transcriptional regulator
MAAKRKVRRGLATNILCVLKHEGKANDSYFARRFGYSVGTVERVLRSLENQGLAQMAMADRGNYFLTQKGWGKVLRSKACPAGKNFAVTRAHSDSRYVPIGGARH